MNRDLRQTKEYAAYMKSLGWDVDNIKGDYVYKRKIPIIGYVAKLQRPIKIITAEELEDFASRNKLGVLYVEPSLNQIRLPGFIPAGSAFLPSKTIHIDLKKSPKTIFSQMKAKTRYNIGLAQRRGVKTITASYNIDDFASFWQKTALKRGMFLPQIREIKTLYRSFGKNAHLLLAYWQEKLVGGILMVRTISTAYYMYVASTYDGKKNFAPTLLVWEALRLAKKKGCKVFDFEGIYDERYKTTKAWKGFTRFKEGFGGKVVEYPPTLVKYYNPIARILGL